MSLSSPARNEPTLNPGLLPSSNSNALLAVTHPTVKLLQNSKTTILTGDYMIHFNTFTNGIHHLYDIDRIASTSDTSTLADTSHLFTNLVRNELLKGPWHTQLPRLQSPWNS